jgi:tripartite-type tricarboxylate transporter receptor subunit TctC
MATPRELSIAGDEFKAGGGALPHFCPLIAYPQNSKLREDCMQGRWTFLLSFIVAASASLCASSASAQGTLQDYPNRPITIVVPFGAGSGTDVMTRFFAERLGNALKQTIVIEDKPGANGAIAAAQVARSAPDGYTLFMTTNSPSSAAPSLNKTIAYDPLKDFAPVARTGSYVFMLAVRSDLPVTSVRELIDYAKANPSKLSYASGNTSGIVGGASFKRWAGIEMLHVPYKTVPQAMNDVLGGRVPVIFSDLTVAAPHLSSGVLRALAVTRRQRSALLSDVPSLHEAGFTNFNMDSWAGVIAPANTPPEITARLNAELRRIIDNPEAKARLATLGFEAFSGTPEELGEFMQVQLAEWTRLIKEAGIEPE